MIRAPEDGASADVKPCRASGERVLARGEACQQRRKMAPRPAPQTCANHLTSLDSGENSPAPRSAEKTHSSGLSSNDITGKRWRHREHLTSLSSGTAATAR